MSRIKARDTKPEILLRQALWAGGARYRLKSSLPGKPDIVFGRSKVVVFVDGCFWHRCPKHFQWPQNNSEFWREKIGKNIKRDKEINKLLEAQGWTVLRFWEHAVLEDPEQIARQILIKVRGQSNEAGF